MTDEPSKFCAFHIEKLPSERVHGCQFKDIPEEELICSDEQWWCPFHAPISQARENDSESAGALQKGRWQDTEKRAFNAKIFEIIKQRKSGNRADLTGVVFPAWIAFDQCGDGENRLLGVVLSHAKFFGGASFENLTLSCEFENVEFYNAAHFESTRFSPRGKFANVDFFGDAWFTEAIFEKDGYFPQAKFHKRALFGGAKFNLAKGERKQAADFRTANFYDEADFEKAKFFGSAYFKLANFNGLMNFRDTLFDGAANFSGDEERRGLADKSFGPFGISIVESIPIDFSGAIFNGELDLSGREFKRVTSFKGAKFAEPPLFHDSVFHSNTNLDDADFTRCSDNDDARAYRVLKHAMENQRAWDEAFRFHALELRSRRNDLTTLWYIKLSSHAYEIISEYGQNIWRPMWLSSVLLFACICVYGIWAYLHISGFMPECFYRDLFTFSVEQVVRPFHVWSHDYKVPVNLSVWFNSNAIAVRIVATLQSLFSLSLITMFVFAVRRRFRMM